MEEQKQERTEQNDTKENVVIVEETFLGTFSKVFKIFVIVVVGLVIFLLALGMAMGFAGIRPPTIDSNALTNPFNKESATPEDPSPNTEPSIKSTETTHQNNDTGNDVSDMKYENAYEAGKIAGKLYAEYDGEESDFWKGFNKESLEQK